MNPVKEITITNPAFQDTENKVYKQPKFYGEECSLNERKRRSTESEPRSVKRIFLVLMAMACLLSIASLVLSVLMLFGKITPFESCKCSQQKGK